ncbi:hypothetical protein DER44DRAFT_816061 [Fusarium oxysporum]|nr:hypothetical protein DER44DRAFT_816061 [Fusarium oxysporum]
MLYLRFGLGRHLEVVLEEDSRNSTRFLKTILAQELVYTTTLAASRLSIIAFYYRIFGVSTMRPFLHVATAITIAWTISTFVPSIRTCWPIYTFWDGTNKSCISIHKFYVGVAIGSIVQDIGLILLPMPYILNLNVPKTSKVLLCITFIFGGFACFVTIFRLALVVSLDFTDLTWNTVDQIIWTALEAFWWDKDMHDNM